MLQVQRTNDNQNREQKIYNWRNNFPGKTRDAERSAKHCAEVPQAPITFKTQIILCPCTTELYPLECMLQDKKGSLLPPTQIGPLSPPKRLERTHCKRVSGHIQYNIHTSADGTVTEAGSINWHLILPLAIVLWCVCVTAGVYFMPTRIFAFLGRPLVCVLGSSPCLRSWVVPCLRSWVVPLFAFLGRPLVHLARCFEWPFLSPE